MRYDSYDYTAVFVLENSQTDGQREEVGKERIIIKTKNHKISLNRETFLFLRLLARIR